MVTKITGIVWLIYTLIVKNDIGKINVKINNMNKE